MSSRRVFAVVLGAVLALALPAPAHASIAASIARKQAEIEATHKRLEERRVQLRFQQVRVADLRRQLSETDAGIGRITASLGGIQSQIRHNERRVAWNRVQLAAARATLQRHNDALRRRLVDVYERGDLGYINVLLSATSFNDFVERWDDIRYLIAANVKTVRARRAAEAEVADAEAGLERRRLALDDSLAAERRARAQLASLAQERAGLADAADLERRSVSAEVAQLEDLSSAEEGQLEAFIRERQRAEAERRAAEAQERHRAAQLAGQAAPPAAVEGAPGDFSWPVSGPITSPFGMRPNPFGGGGFEMHPGLDIGAPMGATITATAGGRVIFAGAYGGYGNAIILDHGGNTSSLYGHCSQIFVSNGQDVQRGQAIGAVGMTGRATGPHLHFEIRIDGVAVDPTARLH